MAGGNSHQRKMERKAEERIRKAVEDNLRQAPVIAAQPPVREPEKSTIWQKVGRYWGSTPVWGVIGMLFGAIASQVSLRLLFIIAWGALFAEFVRIRLFTKLRWRIAGNGVAAISIGILLFLMWRVTPQPKEPPTLDQAMNAVATKFPWLANPPKQAEAKPASTIVVSPLPKLKISLSSGKRTDRTLTLDNSKDESALRNFIINGLGYYLDMRGVANSQAKIEDRYVIPGPLNFKPFDVKAGEIKRIDLNEGRYGIGIHMHDVTDGGGRAFDDMRHYICLRLLFTKDDTAETFVHYVVLSPYGDLFLVAEQPENSGGGVPQKPGEEGWPYSIVRVIKENAREFYGMQYREYQP